MSIDIDISYILSNLNNLNLGKVDEDGNKTIITVGNYSLLYNIKKTLSWKYSWKDENSSGNKIQEIGNINEINEKHRDNVSLLLNNAKIALEQGNVGQSRSMFSSNRVAPNTGGGKKNTTVYKLNGEKVFLIHNNRKIKRSIYLKGNGKTKYCKINKVFISLSKLKKFIE